MTEDHIFHVLLKQLALEKTVERIKVELSLKTDFNLIDAFRMFDPDGTGAASHSALRAVLGELGCRNKEEELCLFMQRFDRDRGLTERKKIDRERERIDREKEVWQGTRED